VATICEPVAYLLAKLPRGISIQKFQRLNVVAPTCSSFEEMLEKLNLMRESIKEGSADDLYKTMLMENREMFVFKRKMPRQHEVVKPVIVRDVPELCIIRKPKAVQKEEIECGIEKLIQDGDLPKGSKLTTKANKATWHSETFLVVGKKESENDNIFKDREEKEFYVITYVHEDYDADDDTVYTIS